MSDRDIDFRAAARYNTKAAGNIWDKKDLPWPLNGDIAMGPHVSVQSEAFALLVASFQASHGLRRDGHLGPNTFAVMRLHRQSGVDTELAEAHDFSEEPILVNGAASVPTTTPGRSGVSNALIIDGRRARLPKFMTEAGISASNYLDDGEHHFSQSRKRDSYDVKHFVIHESVTMSIAQTNRILDNKRKSSARKGKNGGKGYDYGIHLNLAPDGHITCHADLVTDRLVQANQLNDSSIGIEVVNPYNPKYARAPFTKIIDGPWWCWKPSGASKQYTLPTADQMATMRWLAWFICEQIPSIPFEFPTAGLNSRQRRIEGWDDGRKPAPGIVAHRDFASHADGRYILEELINQKESILEIAAEAQDG